MIDEPSIPRTTEAIQAAGDRCLHHSLCWRAVLAGTIAAIGIYLLLTALGVGGGLATFSPMTGTNPAEHVRVGAAMVWSLFAIIALSFGGWIAGHFSGCPQRALVHGVLVWSLALIITLPCLVACTGLGLGRAMKIHAKSLGIGSQALVFAERDLAKTVVKRSHDQLCSFTEEAVQSIPTNAAPKASTRAQREVGFAVTKLFAPGNAVAFQANRIEAINALMVYTEMSEPDATKTIDGWTMSYKNLQTELDKVKVELDKIRAERKNLKAMAEQKARATAEQRAKASSDQAAHHLSSAAMWSFFALLVGLLGASLGARCGAKCALRNANLQCAPGTSV
jgi:hypothetical protein